MKSIFAFCLTLLFTFSLAGQKQIPEPRDFLVNDYAGMLSRQEVVRLGNKLRDYALETSIQIVVVTESSLEGEDIFDYSNRLAQAWGIGGRENDTGILVYVAQQDREIRIQTGYGTEGFLPDAMTKRIIEQIILPNFRESRFYEGLDRGTDAIMQLGKGEYEGDGQTGTDGGGFPIVVIIIVLIVIITVINNYNNHDDDDDGGYYRGGRYEERRRGWRRGGGWIFLPGPGSGGGWGGGGGGGGGFGGGGFGGFGGGGFGGGGAGGSW